jgi:hypothetical protein
MAVDLPVSEDRPVSRHTTTILDGIMTEPDAENRSPELPGRSSALGRGNASSAGPRPARERAKVRLATAIILANYAAQIPYSVHLYGARAFARGGFPLAITLLWFLTGLVLLTRRPVVGYWLTVCFLLADAGFYTFNVIGGAVHGYGPFFHLWTEQDPLLWTVFAIGYLNLVAAAYILLHLLRQGPRRRARDGRIAFGFVPLLWVCQHKPCRCCEVGIQQVWSPFGVAVSDGRADPTAPNPTPYPKNSHQLVDPSSRDRQPLIAQIRDHLQPPVMPSGVPAVASSGSMTASAQSLADGTRLFMAR